MRFDYIADDVANAFRSWLGISDGLTPPQRLIDAIGGGDFTQIGDEFFRHLKRHAQLAPTDRILEIGCGCGRIAVPLTRYLNAQGEFFGLEIMRPAVRWCQKRIQPKFPNFHFEHADIYNHVYNRSGRIQAEKFVFPFPDRHFDVVLLASVFTHMLPEGVEHYLGEIARVLKPAGRCFASFFLINSDADKLLAAGKSSVNFAEDRPPCRIEDPNRPERAVAYYEEFVRARMRSTRLQLREPILYGNWCGRSTDTTSYQDLVIAVA